MSIQQQRWLCVCVCVCVCVCAGVLTFLRTVLRKLVFFCTVSSPLSFLSRKSFSCSCTRTANHSQTHFVALLHLHSSHVYTDIAMGVHLYRPLPGRGPRSSCRHGRSDCRSVRSSLGGRETIHRKTVTAHPRPSCLSVAMEIDLNFLQLRIIRAFIPRMRTQLGQHTCAMTLSAVDKQPKEGGGNRQCVPNRIDWVTITRVPYLQHCSSFLPKTCANTYPD